MPHELPVQCPGWALLSPDQSFDCRPDHTGQQEQWRDQDVEEGEGSEGHRGGEVSLSEEAGVAHEGLWTETHVRRGDSRRGSLPQWKHSAHGKEKRGLQGGTHGDLSVRDSSIILTVISWQCPQQVQDFKLEDRAAPSLSCPLCALRLGQLCPLSDSSPQSRRWNRNYNPLVTVLVPGYLASSATSYPEFPESEARTNPMNHVESEFPSVPDRL